EKSMKKLLTILLCCSLLLGLAACGGKTPAPSTTPSVEQSVEQSAAPSVAPSVEETVAPSVEETPVPTVAPSVEEPPVPTVAPSVEITVEPSVEETVAPTVEPSIEQSVEPSVPAGPTDAELLAAVTFSNRTIRYNGKYQKLEVKNLPEGAEVVYSVNADTTSAENTAVYNGETGVKIPGVYGITATVTLGEASVELSAVLTVNKAKLTITADNKAIDLYAPHPEFTYTVSGLADGDAFNPAQSTLLSEEGEGDETEVPEEQQASFTGALTISTSAERYSEAGIYDITVEGITSNCYDITYKKGKLTIKNYTTDLVVGGLKQNGNNQMTYNGKVVEWQGVNYYGLIENSMNFGAGTVNEAGVQAGFRGLEELAEYNVKAIRFSACFYYKSWWDSAYMKNDQQKEDLMYLIKRFFNKAASLNIGLIPSVFWTDSAAEVMGGNPVSFADPNSDGFKFAMQYQSDLLDAVNDHPALFMWEFGNEWNLSMDIGQEGLTAKHIHDMRVEWTKIIEERNTLRPRYRLGRRRYAPRSLEFV
ncbi:MAG: hypothetical protein II368_04325, partial [Clostridia bacterium]|nr:hypothetical protein [Clostridia bacterium]